eukprot:44151_1
MNVLEPYPRRVHTGLSCHQCKSLRKREELTHCTNGDESNSKHRMCRKKYCYKCLRKFYGEYLNGADLNFWKCPACRSMCCCAACRRKSTRKIAAIVHQTNPSPDACSNFEALAQLPSLGSFEFPAYDSPEPTEANRLSNGLSISFGKGKGICTRAVNAPGVPAYTPPMTRESDAAQTDSTALSQDELSTRIAAQIAEASRLPSSPERVPNYWEAREVSDVRAIPFGREVPPQNANGVYYRMDSNRSRKMSLDSEEIHTYPGTCKLTVASPVSNTSIDLTG